MIKIRPFNPALTHHPLIKSQVLPTKGQMSDPGSSSLLNDRLDITEIIFKGNSFAFALQVASEHTKRALKNVKIYFREIESRVCTATPSGHDIVLMSFDVIILLGCAHVISGSFLSRLFLHFHFDTAIVNT